MQRVNPDQLGLIILAAGGSTRLGQPKQLLPFKEGNLLQHANQVAIDSGCLPIVVVLGAAAAQSRKSLEGYPVHVVENPNWQTGMASSIKTGLQAVLALSPELDGIILMVCDQPFVTPHLLRKMKKEWQNNGKGMVACSYAGTFGTPALFGRDYFKDLLTLEGQEGAKKILVTFRSFISLIPFALGQVDIDTPEDLKSLEQAASCS
jgi:molybdenum cofactor cytidylyltransferase